MKNKKVIICIFVIIVVLLISTLSLLVIKNFSGKKVDNSTKTTTTVEITTTQEKEELPTELVGTTTKSSEVKTTKSTTIKTKSTKVTKKTKNNSTNPTKKVNENKEPTISVSEPVCKNYSLPKGAVLYKDFGKDGTTAMSNKYLEVHQSLDTLLDNKLYDIIDEYNSWFEYNHDSKYSDSLVKPVFCSDGYHVRGIVGELTIHSISQNKTLAIGYIKPDKSMEWIYKDTTCPPEMCKLKE